jgi:hypothetical protein
LVPAVRVMRARNYSLRSTVARRCVGSGWMVGALTLGLPTGTEEFLRTWQLRNLPSPDVEQLDESRIGTQAKMPKSKRITVPRLGMLAILYTVLFNAGLCAVSAFGIAFGVKPPYWPGPWEPSSVIVSYFSGTLHGRANLRVPAIRRIDSSRDFHRHGSEPPALLGYIDAAGPNIALFGGFMTVFNGIAAGFTVWAMIHPGVTQDATLTTALYYLSHAFGGRGFSVPMGLLMAGVCVPAAMRKVLPKWLVAFGLVLAIAGELSWFNLIFRRLSFSFHL